MRNILLILITLVISCSSPVNKENKIISDYVKNVSKMNISSGEIILINSSGCEGCIEKGLAYLEQNKLYSHYKVLIISQRACDRFERYVNKSKFVVDNENLIEKLNISQSGFVVVKLDQSNIDTMFSLNPETDLNILKKYSVSKIGSSNYSMCATCMRK